MRERRRGRAERQSPEVCRASNIRGNAVTTLRHSTALEASGRRGWCGPRVSMEGKMLRIRNVSWSERDCTLHIAQRRGITWRKKKEKQLESLTYPYILIPAAFRCRGTILDDARGKVNYFYGVYYTGIRGFLLDSQPCNSICTVCPVNSVMLMAEELCGHLKATLRHAKPNSCFASLAFVCRLPSGEAGDSGYVKAERAFSLKE